VTGTAGHAHPASGTLLLCAVLPCCHAAVLPSARALVRQRLASLPLARIRAEPGTLQSEYQGVQKQIEDYAFAHYRPLMHTARCTATIHRQVVAIHENLAQISGDLPSLGAYSMEFHQDSKDLLERRNTIANALSHHSQLTEILEIPKLMDTLVRTEAFEEALELANYVGRLKSRHPDARVVGDIAAAVDSSCLVMASMLLRLLRGDVQLPDCLRYISYIRRLRRFDEHELRCHFLACRDCWFQRQNGWSADKFTASNAGEDVSSKAPKGEPEDAYELLMRLVDNLRLHGFRIITQYRAIFACDAGSEDGSWAKGGGLLFSWAAEKLSSLLAALEILLPKIDDGARISSLLSQFIYAGSALGRAGVEFRPLLPGIFEPSLLAVFDRKLQRAGSGFGKAMDGYQWVRIPYASGSSGVYGADAQRPPSSVPEEEGGPSLSVAEPPTAAVQFPPLAILLNGILEALNDIRVCAPSNIAREAARSLKRLLGSAAERILACAHDEEAQGLFADFCRVHAQYVLPHTLSCFEKLFRGGERRSAWHLRAGSELELASLQHPFHQYYEDVPLDSAAAHEAAEPAVHVAATLPDTIVGPPPEASCATPEGTSSAVDKTPAKAEVGRGEVM
jgi:hypothetical protein